MKKYLILTLTAIALWACTGTTTREFRTLDNTLVASCTYEGADSLHAQWQFTDPQVKDCDSLRVVELGPDGHPTTVCFYMGQKELWRQYYSDMQLRSEGVMWEDSAKAAGCSSSPTAFRRQRPPLWPARKRGHTRYTVRTECPTT